MSTTYYATTAERWVTEAQRTLDRHITSSATGRCGGASDIEPVARSCAATERKRVRTGRRREWTGEITVGSDPADGDGIQRLCAAAAEVLRQHAPDEDGWCTGCLGLWGRLVPFPCESAKWAAAVRAAYPDPPG
jgi:hypothetical protein